MVQYSIAVCNYNMADTLERSLRSILDQIDDRYELVIVDDGSTDESVAIVEELQLDYDSLRLIELPPDPGRHLGETRNIGVRQARGEHVFLQLDADDVYEPVIQDFTTIYETFRAGLSEPFLFKGNSLTVAPKQLLLKHGPYRNLPVGAEDLDMWRRLLAADSILWLTHDSPKTEISTSTGPVSDLMESIRRGVRVRTGEFQTGVRPTSRISHSIVKWKRGQKTVLELLFELVSTPYAYLLALARPRYDLPPQFGKKGELGTLISARKETLPEMESRLGISVDRSDLSNDGLELFAEGS